MKEVPVKFSQDLTYQKFLNSVNLWQNCLKNENWTFFGMQCRHVVCMLQQWRYKYAVYQFVDIEDL